MKRIGLFLLALTLFVGAQAIEKGINMDSLKSAIITSSKEIQEQKKDSTMFSKLSSNQILELKKGEQEIQKQQIIKEGRNDNPFNGFELFLIILLPFLLVGTLIFIVTKSQKEESQRKYALYTKSLEMGQTVPDHFFDKPKKANPISNLKKGILWAAIGLALWIYFAVVNRNEALVLGIVPTFLGIGYLLVHFLDKPKTDSTEKNDEQHG